MQKDPIGFLTWGHSISSHCAMFPASACMLSVGSSGCLGTFPKLPGRHEVPTSKSYVSIIPL